MNEELHDMIRNNRVDELQEILKSDVDLDKKDRSGMSQLHCAVREKNEKIAMILLETGADVTIQDNEGKTPLHYAVENDCYDLTEAILKRNTLSNRILDNDGNEPLWAAVNRSKGGHDLVKLLLNYGGNVTHKNSMGSCPLDIPKEPSNNSLLKVLEESLESKIF